MDDHLGSIQIGQYYDISTVGFLRTLLPNVPDRESFAGAVWDALFSGHPPPALVPWLPAHLHSSYPWFNTDPNMTD